MFLSFFAVQILSAGVYGEQTGVRPCCCSSFRHGTRGHSRTVDQREIQGLWGQGLRQPIAPILRLRGNLEAGVRTRAYRSCQKRK